MITARIILLITTERLHGGMKFKNHDYRKNPSLSKENFVLLPDLSLSPTKGEDYTFKKFTITGRNVHD